MKVAVLIAGILANLIARTATAQSDISRRLSVTIASGGGVNRLIQYRSRALVEPHGSDRVVTSELGIPYRDRPPEDGGTSRPGSDQAGVREGCRAWQRPSGAVVVP